MHDYCTLADTHDIQKVIASGSDLNSIHFTLDYVQNTKAKGAFIIIQPTSPGTLEMQSTYAIVTYPKKSFKATALSPGLYKIMIYDMEGTGFLAMPTATPAYDGSVMVLGQLYNDNIRNVDRDNINIQAARKDQTVEVSCDVLSDAQGCMVILQSESSSELHVQTQFQNSTSPLVYSIAKGNNYTITAFIVTQDGIVNSTDHEQMNFKEVLLIGENTINSYYYS